MIQKLAYMTILVTDQDKAVDFYVNVLGFELVTDTVVPGGFRWITVRPRGQTDLDIVLMRPHLGARMTEADRDAVVALIEKGALGPAMLQTADCRATCAELKAKGVEFTREPADQFYGVEAMFRDPFGNLFSLMQRTDVAA